MGLRSGATCVVRSLCVPDTRRVLTRNWNLAGSGWAPTAYVPNWAGHSGKRADYRFLAMREPLRQLALGGEEKLPFPTGGFGRKGSSQNCSAS